MATDDKPSPPNPFDDVRKGLGLLFRAAKTVAQKLPTDPIEKVVLDGAREVGRAVENVTNTVTETIERQVFHKKEKPTKDDETRAAKDAKDAPIETPAPKSDAHDGPPAASSGEEKKPRVG